jgi:hypothetical protein
MRYVKNVSAKLLKLETTEGKSFLIKKINDPNLIHQSFSEQ